MKKLLMVCLALVMGVGIATAAKPAQKKSVTTVFVTDIDCEHCVQKIMNNVPSLGKLRRTATRRSSRALPLSRSRPKSRRTQPERNSCGRSPHPLPG